jgi:hypothetical protein
VVAGRSLRVKLTGDVIDRADTTTATRNLMTGATAKRREGT